MRNRHRLPVAAALLLALPPAASGRTGAARLLVSATVVRTVRVSVTEGEAGTAALTVRTVGAGAWSALAPSSSNGAALPGVAVAPYAGDPRYVVVTVLADAPVPIGGVAASR